MHEAPNAGVSRSSEQVAGSFDHDPAELLTPALADRDEMNDRVNPCDRTAQARRMGHVALDELAPPRRELGSTTQIRAVFDSVGRADQTLRFALARDGSAITLRMDLDGKVTSGE